MNILTKRFEKLDLHVYAATHEDGRALHAWWKYLDNTDGIASISNDPTHRTLPAFFSLFSAPTLLLYRPISIGGIAYAMWFEPFGAGAFVSGWAHPDLRRSRAVFDLGLAAYEAAFNVWPVLASVTSSSDTFKLMKRIGYDIVGSVPILFNIDEAILGTLTREAFIEKWGKYHENHNTQHHADVGHANDSRRILRV